MKKDDISFCLSLIGKPWASGACGPDAFNCWGLVRHVLKARRGLDLIPYNDVTESNLALVMRTATREAAARWEKIVEPVHFCVVAMSRGIHVEHVGLWIDEAGGGVLHSYESAGVVFQTTTSIRNTGFQNFTFYQLRP